MAPVHRPRIGAKSGPHEEDPTLRMTARLLSVLALALLLAGCDKCGNWFGTQAPYYLGACKSTVPQQ